MKEWLVIWLFSKKNITASSSVHADHILSVILSVDA